ncbi:MAG: hypothetical protein P3W94_008800 [Paracoccus sp. (in: a-proteobacteria)]|nr:hypothetical protein [Paracoccus sp. (in: a-proteobacteria)]
MTLPTDMRNASHKGLDAAELDPVEAEPESYARPSETAAGAVTGENGQMSLLAQMESLRAELRVERDTRFQETAILTRMIEEVRAENESLKRHNAELLTSTSWKVTAPLRAVKDALLRLRHRG